MTAPPAAASDGAVESWIDRRRFRAVAADCGWSDEELWLFYRDGTRQQLDEILAAVDAGNVRELKRLAHGARGSSESCGLPGMSELFRLLEQRADGERLEDGAELVERCRSRLGEVERALVESGTGD